MKKTSRIIALIIPLLFSCSNKNQNAPNDTMNPAKEFVRESFYERVFPSPKEDTAYSIPDYVYATDWMQRYIQFLGTNFHYADNTWWTKETGERSYDCRYWSLACVDNDTIPEMLLYGGCWASGTIILTQYSGRVYESPNGYFEFIEGGNGLLHSKWAHHDDIYGEVYEMSNGHFVKKVTYECFTNYFDTTAIDWYGLDRKNMTNWLMEDGTIGISGIEINEKVVDVNYGYYYWSVDKLKPILDSLYYSRGSSIAFPMPVELMPIGMLINKIDTVPFFGKNNHDG